MSMLSRCLLPCLLLLAPLSASAQSDDPNARPLLGSVEGNRYTAPDGRFSVGIPVLEALGGQITDTTSMVTFKDSFSTHVTIAAVPMDQPLKDELARNPRKEFLAKFFTTLMLPGMQKRFTGMTIEPNAVFLPKVRDGAILINTLIPGGTAFLHRILFFGETDNIPVAKRGNLLFVQGDRVYILSSELGERSTARSAWRKTEDEENQILRKQLLGILEGMSFPEGSSPSPAVQLPVSK